MNLLRTKKFIESSNGEAKVDSRNKYSDNSMIGNAIYYTLKSAFALVLLTGAYYGISQIGNDPFDSGTDAARTESIMQNTNLEITKPIKERNKLLEEIQVKVLDVKFLSINDTQDYDAIKKLINIVNKNTNNDFNKLNDSIITERNSLVLAADADNYEVKRQILEDLMTIMYEDKSLKKSGKVTPDVLLNKYKTMQESKTLDEGLKVPNTESLFEKIKSKTVETSNNLVNSIKNKI